jgi:alpha-glucoside transport system substrate-binding protein
MNVYGRRDRKALDQLVEEYTTTNNINRRQFLQRATAAGLSFSAASALLAACGGGSSSSGVSAGSAPPKVTSIDALTEWSGEELDSFNAINAAFTKKTGIKVNVESTRDLPAVLTTRVKGNNPPDIAGMPSVPTFQQLASEGKLVQLDNILNMSQYRQDYAQTWIDFSSVNGHVYAVLPKANSKGTIWYSPKQFQANGYTVPQTWDDMIALSNRIASQGKYPWSMGLESAASSGWPGADWIDQIYLSLNGIDMAKQWVAHKIPWTHPSVKQAFQMFGQIANGKHYINGAPQAILATNFQDSSYLPFDNPPKAYMIYLGDFATGFIASQFPNAQAGTDYNFFPFPVINPQYKGQITGGADIMVAMKDNDGTRQFMQFMASAEGQSIWPKRGGATSVNKSVPLSVYPDPVTKAVAQQLTQATAVTVGEDDLMPQVMENAYWKGVLAYVQNPSQLDSILSSLESTAQQAYSS